MAINQGKAGTRRVVGIQRAQLDRVDKLIQSLLAYNAKLLLRVPPIAFISPGDVTTLSGAAVVCQKYLDQKN